MTIAPAALPNHLTFTLSFNKHSSFEVLNTPIIDTYTIYTGYIHLEYTRFYRDELSHKLATIISLCSQRFVTVSANYISPSSSHSLNLTSPHLTSSSTYFSTGCCQHPSQLVSSQWVGWELMTRNALCITTTTTTKHSDNNNKVLQNMGKRNMQIFSRGFCMNFTKCIEIAQFSPLLNVDY